MRETSEQEAGEGLTESEWAGGDQVGRGRQGGQGESRWAAGEQVGRERAGGQEESRRKREHCE